MSPEAQRIAIAESVGKEVFFDEGENWIMIGDGRCGLFEENSPDYLKDLNAMHEVIETLSIGEKSGYIMELMNVCCEHPIGCVPDWLRDRQSLARLTQATASQKAEAYLRTIGKWEGGSDE